MVVDLLHKLIETSRYKARGSTVSDFISLCPSWNIEKCTSARMRSYAIEIDTYLQSRHLTPFKMWRAMWISRAASARRRTI